MDLQKAIQELYSERDRINGVIQSLEQIASTNGTVVARRRRGRRSMGAEERQVVSERMRSYWAQRRTEKSAVRATA